MNVRSSLCSTAERLASTREHKDVRTSNSFKHTQSIARRFGERRVPMHGGDTQEVQLWVMSGKKNRESVLRHVGISYSSAVDK